MNRRCFPLLVLSLACVLLSRAQNSPTHIPDGPLMMTDSLRLRPERWQPTQWRPLGAPSFPGIGMPAFLTTPEYESKEQRAARVARQAYTGLMNAVDYNLTWYRLSQRFREARMTPIVSLSYRNPFDFPENAVPQMNHSFPFVYAIVPGWAPSFSPYSPESFPQTVRTEYDFASGTHRQVMIPWSEYEANKKRTR